MSTSLTDDQHDWTSNFVGIATRNDLTTAGGASATNDLGAPAGDEPKEEGFLHKALEIGEGAVEIVKTTVEAIHVAKDVVEVGEAVGTGVAAGVALAGAAVGAAAGFVVGFVKEHAEELDKETDPDEKSKPGGAPPQTTDSGDGDAGAPPSPPDSGEQPQPAEPADAGTN